MLFHRFTSLRSAITWFVFETVGLLVLLTIIAMLAYNAYHFRTQKNLQTTEQDLTIKSQQVGKELQTDQTKIQQALNVALLPDQVNQFVDELQQYGSQRHVVVTVTDINTQEGGADDPLQIAKVHVLASGAPDQLTFFLARYFLFHLIWRLRHLDSAYIFRRCYF